MQKDLKVRGEADFCGLTISKLKVVTLKFLLGYSEIVSSVNLMQGLHSDITVRARTKGKTFPLGMYKLEGVSFDKDGCSKITLKAMLDQVEVDNVVTIARLEDGDIFQLEFRAVLEIEGPVDGDVQDGEEGVL